MMQKYPSDQRSFDDKGWLTSHHTFSFDTYYDSQKMGYRELRVINEDKFKPGKGIEDHVHKEIEIVTLMLGGMLETKDNIGNTSIIYPGDLHLVSAGKGIVHREYNISPHAPVHFLQLWFNPEQHNLDPSQEQKHFSNAAKWGQWCLLLSRNGRQGSIRIHQDVDIYATLMEENDEIAFKTFSDRYYWIQVIQGRFKVNNIEISQGDALSMNNELEIIVNCLERGELLLIDLA